MLSAFLFSCDLLDQASENSGLTEEEVVQGLKVALEVGTDTSVTVLNATDGYYKDKIVKILLPEEAEIIYDYAAQLNLEPAIEELVKKVNRSAEDAAIEAKPIFVSAITDMSIVDGFNILQGVDVTSKSESETFDSLAATKYLEYKTRTGLKNLFQPKIQNSLNKELIGGISASSAWSDVFGTYNQFANTIAGQIAGATPVETDLPAYTTDKALDGLFYKIGVEEKEIRKDPFAWALDILEKVFGSIFEAS